MVRKKLQNTSRKRRESYTSPIRPTVEGSQLIFTEYPQSTSKESCPLLDDSDDEIMELTAPSTTMQCRANSPTDLTHRATDKSYCQKLQSISYYMKKYEILAEHALKASICRKENGIDHPDDPEVKEIQRDADYYAQRQRIAVSQLSSPPPTL
ncbi:hypothetical protein TNCV_3741051 [Trichonephila clavipes]|nr:hypothetical protein TNCV_3741051 [Trichonephila clavipes]